MPPSYLVRELQAAGRLLVPTILLSGLFAFLFVLIVDYGCAVLHCSGAGTSRWVRILALVVLLLALNPLLRVWQTRRKACLLAVALGYLLMLMLLWGVHRRMLPGPKDLTRGHGETSGQSA
jgi:hypothetical protein